MINVSRRSFLSGVANSLLVPGIAATVTGGTTYLVLDQNADNRVKNTLSEAFPEAERAKIQEVVNKVSNVPKASALITAGSVYTAILAQHYLK